MSNIVLIIRDGIIALDLPYSRRMVLAFIYGYTSKGLDFFCSGEYASERLGMPARTYYASLSELLSKGYVEKVPDDEDGTPSLRGMKYRPTQEAIGEIERLETKRAKTYLKYRNEMIPSEIPNLMESVKSTAESAQTNAKSANPSAKPAQKFTAESAQTNAKSAQITAESAELQKDFRAEGDRFPTAESAKTSAESAEPYAESAKTSAESAVYNKEYKKEYKKEDKKAVVCAPTRTLTHTRSHTCVHPHSPACAGARSSAHEDAHVSVRMNAGVSARSRAGEPALGVSSQQNTGSVPEISSGKPDVATGTSQTRTPRTEPSLKEKTRGSGDVKGFPNPLPPSPRGGEKAAPAPTPASASASASAPVPTREEPARWDDEDLSIFEGLDSEPAPSLKKAAKTAAHEQGSVGVKKVQSSEQSSPDVKEVPVPKPKPKSKPKPKPKMKTESAPAPSREGLSPIEIELGLEPLPDPDSVAPWEYADLVEKRKALIAMKTPTEFDLEIRESSKGSGFNPPLRAEVEAYCKEKGYDAVNIDDWFEYYTNHSWKVGTQKMKSWTLCIGRWDRNEKKKMKEREENRQYWTGVREKEQAQRQAGYAASKRSAATAIIKPQHYSSGATEEERAELLKRAEQYGRGMKDIPFN